MDYSRYRKHPRTHGKKCRSDGEKVLTLSGIAAAGILAVTFAKGMLWGYILKKHMR